MDYRGVYREQPSHHICPTPILLSKLGIEKLSPFCETSSYVDFKSKLVRSMTASLEIASGAETSYWFLSFDISAKPVGGGGSKTREVLSLILSPIGKVKDTESTSTSAVIGAIFLGQNYSCERQYADAFVAMARYFLTEIGRQKVPSITDGLMKAGFEIDTEKHRETLHRFLAESET